MYYVYMHTNKINGKKYCGITNNIEERWRNNGIAYKPYGRKNSRPFWNAIEKYGWDNFEHEVLHIVENREIACDKEKEIIKELNLTDNEIGYNVAEGGNGGRIYKNHPRGMLGKPQTDYNNQCCRERLLCNNPMKKVKWGITHKHPTGFKGRKHTEEAKEAIRNKLKRKTFSEERNMKISETLKGRVITDGHKEKISETRIEKGIAKGGKNPSAKQVKVVFSDGSSKVYECGKYCRNDLGISQTIFDKCVKSNQPFELSKMLSKELKQKLSPLSGMTISYLENTEITK